MNKVKIFILSIAFIFIISSCSKDQTDKDTSKVNKKEKQSKDNITAGELSKYDLSSQNPTILNLAKDLKEISGMTMTPDGRLFAEQDEKGIVYQLDNKSGAIIKKFSLGNPPIRKDFEDIVYVNNKFYLLHSKGEIYEFEEGNDGESVDYKIYKTELNGANDIEGMCYDPETNSLLLACKGISGVEDDNDKAVYSFSLDSMKFNSQPRFMLKKSDIKSYFNPSGIQRNPKTGTFFVIAANGNEIVEISKEGNFTGKHQLPKSIHAQPEGITFSADGTMFISNEGKNGNGTIVIYPYQN
ncbi:MAG: SdiA-regulated domain-containing protein [Bacteroidota bacterium]|nr:SdiA-regulated domain-containing protein [Bacteroidota bacterium]